MSAINDARSRIRWVDLKTGAIITPTWHNQDGTFNAAEYLRARTDAPAPPPDSIPGALAAAKARMGR